MVDIHTLEAGPELDALVAEKVMGWTLLTKAHGKLMGEVDKDGVLRMWCDGPAIKRNVLDWSPSREIAAAWEVVEKLRLDPRHRALSVIPTTFGYQVVSQLGHQADAETAPLAICRAALAALKAVGA